MVNELYRVHDRQKKPKVVKRYHPFQNPEAKFGGNGWFPCNSENLAVLKKFIPWLNLLQSDFFCHQALEIDRVGQHLGSFGL